jgi:hypothetical protein
MGKRSERLVDAALGGMKDVVAIIIDGGALRASPDLARAIKHSPDALFLDARVADDIIAAMPDANSPDDSRRLLGLVAQEFGARLWTGEEIKTRAAGIADRVARHFDELMRSGRMRDLNSTYRQQRLEAARQGRKKSPAYPLWLFWQKHAMVKKLASTLASTHAVEVAP